MTWVYLLSTVLHIISARLAECLDEVERALLDPVLDQAAPDAHLFFHVVPPIDGAGEDGKFVKEMFGSGLMRMDTAAHAARLLELRVATIRVKVRVGSRVITQDDSSYSIGHSFVIFVIRSLIGILGKCMQMFELP